MKGTVMIIIITGIALTALAQTDTAKRPSLVFKNVKVNLVQALPANQYAKSLGFFCRQELKLEKKLQVPVLFRLGSTDYCNYLEQKPGYSLPK